MAKKIRLLITEMTDDHIKIAGAVSDTGWNIKQASAARPIELPLDKAATYLEPALAHAISGGRQEGSIVMFKYPVTIKAASTSPSVVLDDHGLSEALTLVSEGKLTKAAQNAFCDELVAAIDDAKIDASSTGMELSMPLKLEFRDEATKNAFMNLGRSRKLKKSASDKAGLRYFVATLQKLACSKAMKAKKSQKKLAANAPAQPKKAEPVKRASTDGELLEFLKAANEDAKQYRKK